VRLVDDPKFSVIVADPPWRYYNWTDALNGAAAAHYGTMADEEIAAIPVGSWADDNCILACWGTWVKMGVLQRLCLPAWGFEHVTGFPWIKVLPQRLIQGKIGIGFWTSAVSEYVVIARRGKNPERIAKTKNAVGLLHGDQRVFWSPRTNHSEKPRDVQDWLSEQFDGPYLELFAREKHPGWTCWGGDLGFLLTPGGVRRCEPPATKPMPLFDTAKESPDRG